MKRRRLGRTGLEVSELVFGAGWVGGIIIDADAEVKRQAIRRALDGGINWIDTAPSYGDGASEEALGWLLKEIDDTPYLSTKVRPAHDRAADIAGEIERSFEASLKRLQRQHVHLLQLHNPVGPETTEATLGIEEVLRPGGVADTLEDLRGQGLVDFIGFTAIGDTECCRRLIQSGRFDTAQVYYNILNPSAGQAVAVDWSAHDFGGLITSCREADMGVLNIRVLAAGVIATDVRTGREVAMYRRGSDISAEQARARKVIAALRDWRGTRAQAAIRFALDNPDVSGILVGLAQLSHLDEALCTLELDPISQSDRERLNRLYSSDFKDT